MRRSERGILAGLDLDGRTAPGRFAKKFERELLQHVGERPTPVQLIMIRQAVRMQLQLDQLNAKLIAGEFTDHDRRVFGALNNAFRLALREIGFEAPAARSESLTDVLDGIAPTVNGEAGATLVPRSGSKPRQPSKYRIRLAPRRSVKRSSR
jgi:hypothetical protein